MNHTVIQSSAQQATTETSVSPSESKIAESILPVNANLNNNSKSIANKENIPTAVINSNSSTRSSQRSSQVAADSNVSNVTQQNTGNHTPPTPTKSTSTNNQQQTNTTQSAEPNNNSPDAVNVGDQSQIDPNRHNPENTNNNLTNNNGNEPQLLLNGESLAATNKLSGIPTPVSQSTATSNRMATSASATTASSKPHQRGLTSIGVVGNAAGTAGLTTNTNGVKLKKADTGRGALDFPKSASTDKSRLESILASGRVNNQTTNITLLNQAAAAAAAAAAGATDFANPDASMMPTAPSAIRASHSYRTKAEILHNSSYQPTSLHHQSVIGSTTSSSSNNNASPAAASTAVTVGGASMLTSTINSNLNSHNNGSTSSNIKSQSAVPIKPANDNGSINSNSGAAPQQQKNEIRPRLVITNSFLYFDH